MLVHDPSNRLDCSDGAGRLRDIISLNVSDPSAQTFFVQCVSPNSCLLSSGLRARCSLNSGAAILWLCVLVYDLSDLLDCCDGAGPLRDVISLNVSNPMHRHVFFLNCLCLYMKRQIRGFFEQLCCNSLIVCAYV